MTSSRSRRDDGRTLPQPSRTLGGVPDCRCRGPPIRGRGTSPPPVQAAAGAVRDHPSSSSAGLRARVATRPALARAPRPVVAVRRSHRRDRMATAAGLGGQPTSADLDPRAGSRMPVSVTRVGAVLSPNATVPGPGRVRVGPPLPGIRNRGPRARSHRGCEARSWVSTPRDHRHRGRLHPWRPR